MMTYTREAITPVSLILNEYEWQQFITTRTLGDFRAIVCHMVVVARSTLDVCVGFSPLWRLRLYEKRYLSHPHGCWE